MSEIIKHQSASLDIWGKDFEQAQRRAKALVESAIFPVQFKDVGSCMIVLDMAQRLGMSPMLVAQSIHVVQGNPCWKSSYIIECLTRQYDKIDYIERIDGQVDFGDKKIPNKCLKIVATDQDGRTFEGTEVSFKMAIDEGWWSRKGSKWQTLPDQMLVYRAASFFDRKWPSQRTEGLRTIDEIQDIQDVPYVEVPATESPKTVTNTKPKMTPVEQPKTEPKPNPTVVDILGDDDEDEDPGF